MSHGSLHNTSSRLNVPYTSVKRSPDQPNYAVFYTLISCYLCMLRTSKCPFESIKNSSSLHFMVNQ
jgi:hypothetical protein